MLDFYLAGQVNELSKGWEYFSDERGYVLIFLFAGSLLLGLEGGEGIVGGFSFAEGT